MDVTASLVAPCPPADLFAHVDALDGYPAWMPLAHHVAALPPGPDGSPAWQVELRARMGPLARSKRLRMVRTLHDRDECRARFERRELDGRSHSPWVLAVEVLEAPAPDTGSELRMHLHYGGALWTGGVMERVLAEQIVAGRERLLAIVAG